MPNNLQKLYLMFDGNIKKIVLMIKLFDNDHGKFSNAVKESEWRLNRLENHVLELQKQKMSEDQQKVESGKVEREKNADKAVREHGDVKDSRAKDILKRWYILDSEFKAYGYNNEDKEIDLTYLEIDSTISVGDLSLSEAVTLKDSILKSDPLVIFSKRVKAFLDDANELLHEFEGNLTKKDSYKAMEDVCNKAEIMSNSLSELFNKNVPKPRKMEFSEQNMVPQHSDFEDITRKSEISGIDTSSQAWALAGSEKKGDYELSLNRLKAMKRLEELNSAYGTKYLEEDLDYICGRMDTLKIATNYHLNKKPGGNLDLGDEIAPKDEVTLLTLLTQSEHFKNVWETGKSQASTELSKRGGVEERMGYSTALKRTKGTAHTYVKSDDTEFDPSDSSEMPKYAASVSSLQPHGVSMRYGKSVVYWKDDVRERITLTPGDSWNQFQEGVKFFTSRKHPEIIIANAALPLVRLAAAEATGQDRAFLKELKRKGGLSFDGYIETQIHGKLTWDDVDTIVVGEDDSEKAIKQLKEFKKLKGFSFTVRKK